MEIYIVKVGDIHNESDWGVLQDYFITKEDAEEWIYSLKKETKKIKEDDYSVIYENDKEWFTVSKLKAHKNN